MRILIASDAWEPQINGVVVTLRNTAREMRKAGHCVDIVGPARFRSIPCPTYPEIRLALGARQALGRELDRIAPDAIHISTEGPIGMAMRSICLERDVQFTTAYHTRFPEYLYARTRLPTAVTYAWLRRFHAPARAVMVATPAIERDLARRGFTNLARWSRGVDTSLFRPGPALRNAWRRPVFMCVGRVAVEKNIAAFLALDVRGTKVVVGEGPQRASLQRRFADAVFAGAKSGEDLAAHYRSADVLVFPSTTDTFGLVMVEAMACGTPVAAFPVAGPLDVVVHGENGVLGPDLRASALAALALDRTAVRRTVLNRSWARATEEFTANLWPCRTQSRAA